MSYGLNALSQAHVVQLVIRDYDGGVYPFGHCSCHGVVMSEKITGVMMSTLVSGRIVNRV